MVVIFPLHNLKSHKNKIKTILKEVEKIKSINFKKNFLIYKRKCKISDFLLHLKKTNFNKGITIIITKKGNLCRIKTIKI